MSKVVKRQLGEDRIVDISVLVDNPLQHTSRATEVAVEGLLENYKLSGFLAPIVVVPMKKRSGLSMVCDGHRRKKVAELLGLREVKVTVIEGDPQEMFIYLNGGIRNVKGRDWWAVWALAEDRDHILSILPATQRYRIAEAVNIFGEFRAIEIGKAANRAPHIVDQINSVAKMLAHFDIPCDKKALGEWVIEYSAQRWIREHTEYKLRTAKNIAEWVRHGLKPGARIPSGSGQRRLKSVSR